MSGKQNRGVEDKGLVVIGAGVARTGTTSLKAALELLLGGPCYHMYEVFRRPGHTEAWHAAVKGEVPDWEFLLGDFTATVDFPAAAFWKPLAEAYPDALVLLSVRDSAEDWFRSVDATLNELLAKPPATNPDWYAMTHDLLRTRFAAAPLRRAEAIEAYEHHNTEVRSAIPSERLLEWKPSEGWEPICARLGLPVPDEDFPRLNTADEYRNVIATQAVAAARQRVAQKRKGRDVLAAGIETAARPARRLVGSSPRAQTALRRARNLLPQPKPEDPLEQVIFEFGRAYPRATFIQIGANDGVAQDPVQREASSRSWRGVMVEPVPYVFARLRKTYGHNKQIALENAAIGDSDGTRELYYLAEAGPTAPPLPDWYDNLGTFHREIISKHREAIPDFDERLRTLEVPCMTLDSLCRKHRIETLDLLHTDTEGHDYEVLKLADLNTLRPRIIMYEHLHFDQVTRDACSEYLRGHGYEQLGDAVNTIALRTVDLGRRDRALQRYWRRLLEADRG